MLLKCYICCPSILAPMGAMTDLPIQFASRSNTGWHKPQALNSRRTCTSCQQKYVEHGECPPHQGRYYKHRAVNDCCLELVRDGDME